MKDIGKRDIYVIISCSNWEGLDSSVIFVSGDRKETVKRFEWLYDKTEEEFLDEDGNEDYTEKNYYCEADSPKNKNKISGSFYYENDSGITIYKLSTLHTNAFFSNGFFPKFFENLYRKDKGYELIP